jgi:hypothetical protein
MIFPFTVLTDNLPIGYGRTAVVIHVAGAQMASRGLGCLAVQVLQVLDVPG